MADFVLRKVDRWKEVEDFERSASRGHFDIQDFWKAAGQGKHHEIAEMLAYYDLIMEDQVANIVQVRLIAIPDDIHGTVHRLWVRMKPEPQDWSPRKR